MSILRFSALTLILCSASTLALAGTSAPTTTLTKTYQLSQIKLVVSNDSKCARLNQSLQALAGKTLSFQFTHQANNQFSVSDSKGQFQNHQYQIASQSINGVLAVE